MEAMSAEKNNTPVVKMYGLNLSLLEEKVALLVEALKCLKLENQAIKEENHKLQEQLRVLEESLVLETKGVEELHQEKMMTKMVVDDLLRSIDELIQPMHAIEVMATEQETILAEVVNVQAAEEIRMVEQKEVVQAASENVDDASEILIAPAVKHDVKLTGKVSNIQV